MTAEKYKINSDEKKPTEVVESPKCLSFFSLFRFATWLELFLILIAILFSGVSAAMMPLIIITYGEFTTILVERAYNTGATSNTTLLHFFDGGKSLVNATQEEIRIEIENDSLAYLIWLMIFAGIQMVSGILFIDIFNFTALRQITRIRTKFFQSIICQEIGWYDKTSDYNFASRLTDDIDKIRDGISEKLGVFSSLVMSFIICIGISLGYGWKLSLVVLACVPVLIFCNHFVLKFQSSLTAKELDAYSSAGSVAEEVLSSIRTVVAFGGEEKESERYAKRLKNAQTAGKRKGAFSGIGEGILRMFFYICNAVAFWYGVSLILNDRDKEDREYTPAVLMIAFFGILVGAENLAKSAPFLEAFATARASATTIFDVIDRKSAIDPLSREGKIINHGIKGDIEFQDVDFYYPSRSDVKVLSRFNLKVQAGQTVALIGHSGCGKSTIVQLLQRFYDPNYGKVFMDNYDIKTMNIAWLRSNIAVVGQEPVLFGTTIENNIRYGRMDATRREIEDAAKSSGVHDFIMTLPEGYETQVGDLGSQLSGGQKQRIAIARALIQNPKILLLDEATSALDSQTEKQVQETLDRAAKGRTTIVVTHKLGSVRKADQIILIEKGVIKEQGTHFDLMKLQGKYYNMVRVDTIQSSLHHHDDEEDEEVKEIEGKEKLLKVFDRQESTKKLKVTDKVEDVQSEEDDIGKVKVGAVCKRLLKMAKPEWGFLFIGAIGAAVVGMSYPAFAVLLGNIYGALSLTDPDDVNHETNISCICFLVVGAVVALCIFLQNFLFNTTGVILTTKLRQLAFRSMIGQEMGWFDQDVNSVGGLSARLSGDAANVRAAVGQPIGGIISALATLICGVAVAMSFSWKLALVCMCFVPLVLSSVIFEAKFMTSSMLKEKAAIEEATKIATTAIMNIRTVASLRQETHFISRFTAEIFGVERIVRRKLAFRGTVFSTGQSVPMFAYAIALYYGGILVAREGLHYQNLIRVSDSLIYAAMMTGQSLAFVPSLTAAFVAANRMFNVIDRKPLIQSPAHGEKKKQENESTINYKNIDFRYPTRTQMQVLNNMTLEVPSGKTVALVGPSGCGKSTCVQLLQRLYDPDRGRIFLNANDISTDLKIPELRSKIGIVSQEPVLFDKTIAENIAYGDNNREVELTEIIEAAKIANIHSFIASLPLGYDTSLGAKGTQLSGGQKQRIAIARALVRNPKILILDEATSALDTESEKIVQQALDLAKSGRTCLVIAHRLSTIQNADLICVVHRGRIAEMGTHDELMSLNGLYFKLYNQLIV